MEPLRTVGENANGAAIMENDMDVFQILKMEPPRDPGILLLDIFPKEMTSVP